jgi:hypothetical protein
MRKLLVLLMLTGLLWACASGQSRTATPGQGEEGMSEGTYSGAIPDQLDVRLERRDREPLPAGALVKFQAIGRGKSPEFNYRWLLYEDGRWFLAWHSGDTSDWQTPFDTDLPASPTKNLGSKVVKEVKKQLQQANFSSQPPYQADKTVEDGSFYVVTARVDDQVHEVIYEAVYPPLVAYLESFVSTYQ